jgi:1,4-dihydroxy-2-naphthoate octaprenyltransferase
MPRPAAFPIYGWLALLPLLVTGLLPFTVGSWLAPISGLPLRPGIYYMGAGAVCALILAAAAAQAHFGNRAPGLGRAAGYPLSGARALSWLFLGLAGLAGLSLQFWWHTGDFTIPLGALGALMGYFSFAPPLAFSRRGWGEIMGALAFGLLPVGAGLYLQCGRLLTEVLLYGAPLSLAAFNMFLIHGFPAPEAEPDAPRLTLAARLGPTAAALTYTVVNILTMAALLFILFYPAARLPLGAALWGCLGLAAVNQELVKRRAYREKGGLLWLGRLTFSLHLALGLVFAAMLWLRWHN